MNQELSANTTLSHYRIVEKLGAGGVGEVYRARDTRLGRDVAIKVLPADFAKDADRLRRFEQEARATSALNHPNILTIYDIGTHEGAPFIVAELLEGEELRAQLDGGALSVRRCIEYAQQITAGLSAAHEKGVVHRDLKPENLFVTQDGRVKILDFGLAKLKPQKLTGGADSNAPTKLPLTDPGVVMGTVGYMSPEQVRGGDADHRSDIFSFGIILYEMLSGQRPFQGESLAETMAAIVKEDVPELSEANTKISPQLEKIVRRCLEKKPALRFQSASDLGFALGTLTTPSGSRLETATALPAMTESLPARSRLFGQARLAWLVAAAAVLIAALALGVAYFNRSATDTRVVRFSFTPPPNLSFNDAQPDEVIVSPDGQKLAFTARSAEGKWQLWVRSLDSLEAQLLPGTDDPYEPFWSPDSRSIAFGSRGKLKRVDLVGGNSHVICDAARLIGGSWGSEGVIVFNPDYNTPLFQVSATGGEPKAVTALDEARGDSGHASPSFLPDGQHFLFRVNSSRERRGVWVGSLDSPQVKQILTAPSHVAYVAPGWLLYFRNQILVAQSFDAARLELQGEAIPITTRPASSAGQGGSFSASENGVLTWQDAWERDYQLVWVDRDGKQSGVFGPVVKQTRDGQEPRISPDGKRVVIKRDSAIWVIDVARHIPLRLMPGQIPIWSPDGNRVAFLTGPRSSTGDSRGGLTLMAANGVGQPEYLSKEFSAPGDWSPDGRFIVSWRRGDKTRSDIWVLPLFGDKKEYPLLDSAFDEMNPRISPNGRWLAYRSDESDSYEIYVRSFTPDGKVGNDKKRISTNGGALPTWRRDGQELFYLADDDQMMSVAVKTGGAEFESGTPKALFKTHTPTFARTLGAYDVTADGQRFLIGTFIGESKVTPPTVILNWTAEVKK
jgi:serine/threonine protein kinase